MGWGWIRKGGKGWGAGLLRRLPVVLATLMRGSEAGIRAAGLATTPPGSSVRPLPALWLQNPLSPSCRQTLLNLTISCGRRGWGAARHEYPAYPDTGFSGSSPKFKFPLARFFFLDPSAAPGLGGFFWGNDPAWEGVGVGSLGSGRPGNEGVSAPSRLSGRPASAPRTAHLCRSRGAGGSRAAGARGTRRGQSPCYALLPKRSASLSTSCVSPQSEADR